MDTVLVRRAVKELWGGSWEMDIGNSRLGAQLLAACTVDCFYALIVESS